MGHLRVVAVLLIVLLPTVALGNGPSVGFGAGGIVPLASEDIQLVSEFVTVPVEGGRVRCQYDLKNLGDEPRTFTIAFVTDASRRSFGETSAKEYRDADFSVRVDWQD